MTRPPLCLQFELGLTYLELLTGSEIMTMLCPKLQAGNTCTAELWTSKWAVMQMHLLPTAFPLFFHLCCNAGYVPILRVAGQRWKARSDTALCPFSSKDENCINSSFCPCFFCITTKITDSKGHGAGSAILLCVAKRSINLIVTSDTDLKIIYS